MFQLLFIIGSAMAASNSATPSAAPSLYQNQKTVRVNVEFSQIMDPLSYISYRAEYQCQLNAANSFVWLSKIIPMIPNYAAIYLPKTDPVNQQQINCSFSAPRALQLTAYSADLIFTVDPITPIGMPLATALGELPVTPPVPLSLGVLIAIGAGGLATLIVLTGISLYWWSVIQKENKMRQLVLPVSIIQKKNVFATNEGRFAAQPVSVRRL
jgi:hypothetical protein